MIAAAQRGRDSGVGSSGLQGGGQAQRGSVGRDTQAALPWCVFGPHLPLHPPPSPPSSPVLLTHLQRHHLPSTPVFRPRVLALNVTACGRCRVTACACMEVCERLVGEHASVHSVRVCEHERACARECDRVCV